jgi:hypothetical protein
VAARTVIAVPAASASDEEGVVQLPSVSRPLLLPTGELIKVLTESPANVISVLTEYGVPIDGLEGPKELDEPDEKPNGLNFFLSTEAVDYFQRYVGVSILDFANDNLIDVDSQALAMMQLRDSLGFLNSSVATSIERLNLLSDTQPDNQFESLEVLEDCLLSAANDFHQVSEAILGKIPQLSESASKLNISPSIIAAGAGTVANIEIAFICCLALFTSKGFQVKRVEFELDQSVAVMNFSLVEFKNEYSEYQSKFGKMHDFSDIEWERFDPRQIRHARYQAKSSKEVKNVQVVLR